MIRFISKLLPQMFFRDSASYWEMRYKFGGDSGAGSYGSSAAYKAAVLNAFVAEHRITAVIEFGCGDGNQLSLAEYPRYFGIDVSSTAVSLCRSRFQGDDSKSFVELANYRGETAPLALSLDVLFHLVEDAVYLEYLDRLFAASERFVIIFSTSTTAPGKTLRHVRHRDVLGTVAGRYPGFERLPSPPAHGATEALKAEFFIYRRR